jgi:hypothetical protein
MAPIRRDNAKAENAGELELLAKEAWSFCDVVRER